MIPALLQQMTPEFISEVVKHNPYLVLHTLQKFKTFTLLGSAMNESQQVIFSKNISKINDFLASEDGKVHVKFLIDGFSEWIDKQQTITERL